MKYGERYATEIEEIPEILKEEEIVMAFREMRRASEDDEIREILEMREKARHDEASRILNAKAEGKVEEGRNLLLRLLRKKFKELPRKIENKIKVLDDSKTIERIVESVFEIKSIDELAEILNL